MAAPANLRNNQMIEDLLLGWWVLLGIIENQGWGGDDVLIVRKLRTVNFEDFGILTSIFPFDSATMGRVPTLPVSVWPADRCVKEVTREKWHIF